MPVSLCREVTLDGIEGERAPSRRKLSLPREVRALNNVVIDKVRCSSDRFLLRWVQPGLNGPLRKSLSQALPRSEAKYRGTPQRAG